MTTTLTFTIISFGLLLALVGLIGCILPIIPGPPLSYFSLIILSFIKNWEPFSPLFLIVMGGLTLLVLILDYIIPVAGAKKFGASKLGIWGSVIGMIIGFFLFPPFGLFIGGFIGAIAGELFAGKSGDDALRSGVGVFVGSLATIGLKMGICGLILFFYVKEMFS